MNSVWQQFTLSNLRLYQWRSASYLYRVVGLLQSWRSGSLLLQWSEPIGALLVALVFALAPFTSNALVGVLLVACGAFWLLLTLSDDLVSSSELSRRITPIHLIVLLYWGIYTVATALSPVKVEAAKGLGKLTLYLVFFALMSMVLRSPRLRAWIIGVFLHISLIVSVYGIRQYLFGVEELATWTDPTSESANVTRVFSYLGNPNLLAGYLLPAVALSLAAIFAWQRWLPKALAVTMFLLNSGCLILTYSRGGWIGFVICLLLFLVMLVFWYSLQLPPRWRIWAMPSLLGICVAAMALGVIFVPPLRHRVASMFAGREDSSNNFRINVWYAVLDMIRDRPIIGIGPGNNAFNKIYPLFQRPRFTALSAYSIFLEVAVETGLIGFSCFLWLLIVTFNLGVQQLKRLRDSFNPQGFWLMAAISAIAGMLGHGLVDTVWYRPEVSTLWWLMVALIASYYFPPQVNMLMGDGER
ncbi:IctB family putative bicarbonate transporter [Limnofasciculus baicalensis]|uniref:IctB family putative bicarbonate transporter n=1 Tax=Limnofasciculus baicalensis BBK-W-15 TaxID=2699891 RepID=A0AAE3GQQ3_9CYAN|nr:IctB family putative bicarbonate transporter [Limnofasciculus baicalensis]MCP2728454.1 IctB family putative bicarbonate transporter [Limnofasciculus baicalensis BBK-W-15]